MSYTLSTKLLRQFRFSLSLVLEIFLSRPICWTHWLQTCTVLLHSIYIIVAPLCKNFNFLCVTSDSPMNLFMINASHLCRTYTSYKFKTSVSSHIKIFRSLTTWTLISTFLISTKVMWIMSTDRVPRNCRTQFWIYIYTIFPFCCSGISKRKSQEFYYFTIIEQLKNYETYTLVEDG